MARRLAYLGPPGTYSEEAALLYDCDAELVAAASLPGVIDSLHIGEADEGIVPIENSLEGAVTFTADLLIHETQFKIKSELVLPIHHCLFAKEGADLDAIEVVYSHPQSLGQCRDYLRRRFPDATRMPSLSNSAAVGEMVDSELNAVAIAGKRAASFFDVQIIDESVEDNHSNATRFIVLASEDGAPTGNDKTSICFHFDADRPGSLVGVLMEFSDRGINLNKIESRPTRLSLGRYFFLADIEGHHEDEEVRHALEAIAEKASTMKVLGSYPKFISE
ncbi:MAG: prephenate dehydratase [Chloroflexi bacterium]|nr:prephenate dehydratase [Chloroflexota bacterium]MCY3638455.1 prephenate dehydratase [Chloroflexota bacterium]